MSALLVDTNVIMRYFTGEPEADAARANVLMAEVVAGRVSILVEDVVVAELVWVLGSLYKLGRDEIGELIANLLALGGVENPDKPTLQAAIASYRSGKMDFADALLAARALSRGQHEIYSFDRDFDRIPGVERRDPGMPA